MQQSISEHESISGFEFDIFISYARTEKNIVYAFVDKLRKSIAELHGSEDLRTWMDTEQISKGVDFKKATTDGILKSACYLIFLSRNSVASQYCQEDMKQMINGPIPYYIDWLTPPLSRIFPIELNQGFDDGQIPNEVVDLHRFSIDEKSQTEPNMASISNVIYQSLKRFREENINYNQFSFFDTGTQAKLHSDIYADQDELGYDLYAKIIAGIITGNDSPPPMNIAVIAPWGSGKTTLMRLIEKQIVTHPKRDDKDTISMSYQEFIKILSEKPAVSKKLTHPTVWFNPWKYRNSEELWSGLAHSIIEQLVGNIPNQIDRERFWLSLQLSRIDHHSVRQEIHKKAFGELMPFLIRMGMAGLIIVILSLFLWLPGGASKWVTGGTLSVSVITTFLTYLWKHSAFLNKKLSGVHSNLVKPPKYSSRLGIFHEVNEDLKIVFKLLVDEKKPAVVFIDDLDRCSPSVAVEVIEAINSIMVGEFSHQCYFILGMDEQMVVAALDTEYERLKGKFHKYEKKYGSIGWYFMNKFIQLPFVIPGVNEYQKEQFMRKLFDQAEATDEVSKQTISIKELEENSKLFFAPENEQNSQMKARSKLYALLRHANQNEQQLITNQLVKSGLEHFKKDSKEVQEQVGYFARHLGSSPRLLKRFANLFRFYFILYQNKLLLLNNNESNSSEMARMIGKWAVLTLNWPMMVRWIQTEEIEELSTMALPVEKAKQIDLFLSKFLSSTTDKGNAFAHWCKFLNDEGISWDTRTCRFPWLIDQEWFEFMINEREYASLSEAVSTGLW